MTRILQLARGVDRRVAVVEEPRLLLLSKYSTLYGLAHAAIAGGTPLESLIRERLSSESLEYDPIYNGESDWRLLPPIDHPDEAARCLVSGTGLTHLGSAKDRNAMHEAPESELTDSMKMFRWGEEGGRPVAGAIGVAPEWFYKGNGTILRPHGESLVVPSHSEDGGEEGEIAGVYLIGPDGGVHRLGMCNGNEFSDHVFERKNYLNLAGSKLRTCSLGPELVVGPAFESVPGRIAITRAETLLWSKQVRTGEAEMCHSLANIEHHHFKFEPHRRPGDVHVHYFGASILSYGEGIRLQSGDLMEVGFDGFGRALRNSVQVPERLQTALTVRSLG
jgi:hypothetical protein